MKQLPKVLILGRPNVGKSTLLNRIIGQKKAITLDVPGVTRDLFYFETEWEGKKFYLVDSGGVLFSGADQIYLQSKIDSLVQECAKEAKQIIFLTDYTHGIHPTDNKIAEFLRPYKEKVVVAVNKIDNPELRTDIGEFYKLGLGTPIGISSLHGAGIKTLLDITTENMKHLPKLKEQANIKRYKIAIVGRPNVGKSSLINGILNEERVIVDNVAGTTRDSIEVFFKQQDAEYYFIDTAGIRKKARIDDGIEFYSVTRSKRSIEESDLTIVLLDASYYMCDQDKKIINMVLDAHKPMIIFVNKWDLMERTDQVRKNLLEIAQRLDPLLENYPFIFGSALDKSNIGKLFQLIPEIIENSKIRITTPKLNQFIESVIKKNPPPAKNGKHIKIYYATQMETSPPKFLFFVNHPRLIVPDYKRFIERRIRSFLCNFEGVPILLYFRGHQKDKEHDTN